MSGFCLWSGPNERNCRCETNWESRRQFKSREDDVRGARRSTSGSVLNPDQPFTATKTLFCFIKSPDSMRRENYEMNKHAGFVFGSKTSGWSESHTRRQVHVLFFQQDDQSQESRQTNSVMGTEPRCTRNSGKRKLSLLTSLSLWSLLLPLSVQGLEEILFLSLWGFLGRGKSWCHPLPDGSIKKEKKRKRAPWFLHNSHIL